MNADGTDKKVCLTILMRTGSRNSRVCFFRADLLRKIRSLLLPVLIERPAKGREAVHEMNHGRLPVNCWDWPEADCMRFPKGGAPSSETTEPYPNELVPGFRGQAAATSL